MRRLSVIAVVGLSLFLACQNAFAFSWVFTGSATNGDTNLTSPETPGGLIVGLNNVGSLQTDNQLIQISGAGTTLTGYSGLSVNFNSDIYSWDVYKGPDSFYDVFAVVLSEQDYYWNLPNTGIHPLENNPALILGNEPYGGYSYWGGSGLDYDYILENSTVPVAFNFNTDPAKTYYLSIFLQTTADENVPSWGTMSNLNVAPIPEPATLSLLGLGLLGLVFRRKR